MAKIEDGELNRTMVKIMDYLLPKLADGDRYIPYRTIAQAINKSYGSVKYSINKLRAMHMLYINDGKLSLSEPTY